MPKPNWQIAGRRNAEEEAEAQAWVEQVIQERFPPGRYEDALRDGIILCKLMNKLMPGSIKRINTSGGDYKFMDNIQQFLHGCTKFGVPDVDLFQSCDLIEQKNIVAVTMTLYALGRATYMHPEWNGPHLGPKPAEENLRNFSEDVMRAGETMIGLQAGSNKGASQAGQNFGATRKILLGK
ncbi:Muscle-specific protein 20 [Orchesella cincta]|uniref:Calponin n=1 Tax=Orchesella cincta TaxID=48709 RepID=A0A1D2NEF4_ORCCI|nr:Muscle-specific protein 20 [Orchesella cincta]